MELTKVDGQLINLLQQRKNLSSIDLANGFLHIAKDQPDFSGFPVNNFIESLGMNDFHHFSLAGATLERCTGAKCTVNFEDSHKLLVGIHFLINRQGLSQSRIKI